MTKLTWPAPERNKAPILDVLRYVLPRTGKVLELASGTGQHIVHFARELPDLIFQPTDLEPENLDSISTWVSEAQLPNVLPPRLLDVCAPDWGVGQVDVIYCANLLHIAPWECSMALFEGVKRHLATPGVVVLYGPYRIGGEHTAPSNAAFDTELRARDASWGVRDVEAIAYLADDADLSFSERVEMPANNQCLVFRNGPTSSKVLDTQGVAVP